MSDILNKTIVLVLNRNWQAINIRTPQDAFCQMATNVATALDIEGESHIRPVTWDEWITLPVRESDYSVRTARGAIRVPTVIVAIAIKATTVIHDSCRYPAALTPATNGIPITNTRRNDAKAAAFGPVAINPVIGDGAPS